MLKSVIKIIAGDLDNFFCFLYRTYGPFFFLLLSGVFILFALTPDVVEKNGFPVPPAFWWFCSVSYLIMFFDMLRQEKKRMNQKG